MKFITQVSIAPAAASAKFATDAVVVGVFQGSDSKTVASAEAQALIKRGTIAASLVTDAAAATGRVTHLTGADGTRVFAVGLGNADKLDAKAFTQAAKAAFAAVTGTSTKTVAFGLMDAKVKGLDVASKARIAATAAVEASYRFDITKSKKDPAVALATVSLVVDAAQAKAALAAAATGEALGEGINLTRTLGNLPGNICTPTYLANEAKKLAKTYKLGVEVLDKKQCEALKMGSFLSVAKGSDEAPKFIVLKYTGAGKAAPHVLVGKGITFDSGGISIKPGEGMDEMKFDMCGAASVIGTFRAIAQIKPKINLVGLIPACENMPSGRANKPGDIVTSMSGQTIEILNTDAEGRLILNDALTYAKRFKPASVVDIATLTGACVIALGHVHTGLFTKDEKLAADLLAAGQATGDTAWRMPLDDDYQEMLKSNFADMANIGGRPGGAITAACFLARYADDLPWAHLDIAGTAWKSGAAKGATGRPVSLLTHYLLGQAA
jgi:leucyl aminopeptidase